MQQCPLAAFNALTVQRLLFFAYPMLRDLQRRNCCAARKITIAPAKAQAGCCVQINGTIQPKTASSLNPDAEYS